MNECDRLLEALAKVEELRHQGGSTIMGSPLAKSISELTRACGLYLRSL